MPLTRSDIPNLMDAGIKTLFFQALESAAPGDWERVAVVVPSEKDSETYAWLGQSPSMREWKDERNPVGLSEFSYSITNKLYESSIAVARTAIEDEQYGQIRIRIQQLAQRARIHPNTLVFALLAAGFTTTCYDGQYFFDTDHSEGSSGTQSNKGTSALAAATLQAGITAMMKFKDDRGETIGVKPNLLVVPPDLQWTAMELLESTYWPETSGSAGTVKMANNVLKGKLDLLVSPFLSDTSDWFLLDTSHIVKPVIFQQRTPIEFGALEAESENGFMRDEFVYGVRSRYNVGYGPWQYAYGAVVG